MRKSVILSLGVIAVLAGCQFEESYQEDSLNGFDVSLESIISEPETKTYADEQHLVVWHNDDRVSVFEKKEYWEEYKYTGRTGTTGGRLDKITSEGSGTGGDLDYYYAVYPHSELNGFNSQGHLLLTLPHEQQYDEFSFGRSTNLMVSSSEDDSFKFKNIGGYLVFKLYGEGVSVSSIRLVGNNEEEITGDIDVVISPGTDPVTTMSTARYAEKYNDAVLVCDPPIALGATAAEYKEFWFVLPPMTFEGGFSIEVTTADGDVWTKTTEKPWTITRNHYTPVSAMEVVLEPETTVPIPEAVDMGLSVKWASFNLGASDSNEAGDYYAWGETSTKDSFTKKNYKYFQPGTWPESYYATKYCPTLEDGYQGYTDNYTVLTREDDAATLLLGVGWRIPTMEEYQELLDNCTFTKVSNGWKVKSNVNGNSIYFPAVGYKQDGSFSSGFCCYWSSSLQVPYSNGAYTAYFNEYASPKISVNYYHYSRHAGMPIRPVYSTDAVGISDLTLDKSSVSILTRRSQQLHAEVITTSAAINTYIEWSSSDPSIATVDYQGNVSGIAPGTATISARILFTSIVKTCEVTVLQNQLSTNNHEYVDLGLSVLWSTTNIGASSPEEFGDYYAWGDTSPYYSSLSPLVWKADKTDGYVWSNYKYCKGSKTTLTRYCNSSSSGYNSYTDAYTELLLEDDAAHVNWGGDWHIPSYYHATELVRKCKWEKTTINSVEGYLVTGPNGNSIFLPSAGYYEQVYFRQGTGYWTNSLYSWNSAEPEYAWSFGGAFVTDLDYVGGTRGNGFRERGYVIRPVCW